MKHIIVLLLLVAPGLDTKAQTPQFFATTYSGTGSPKGSWPVVVGQTPNRMQCIYPPNKFPGVTEGNITNVYLRNYASSVNAKDTVWYKRFTIKLGYTADSAYKTRTGSFAADTYRTNLTTVVDVPGKQFTGMKTNAVWRKLPLNSGNFYYAKSPNLVVEVVYDSVTTSLWWLSSNGDINIPVEHSISGKASIDSGVLGRTALDFGFDIATSGVEARGKIRSFGMFPNPSADGRFNISLNLSHAAELVTVSITNVIGQEIKAQTWLKPGTQFLEELTLANVPKGVYIVTTFVDNERLVRRLSIE